MENKYQLYQGDCLDFMRGMDAGSVDAIYADVPYNEVNRASNGLRNLDKGLADSGIIDLPNVLLECFRICTGSIYIFCGIEQVSFIRAEMVRAGMSTRLCIWEKTNPSPMNGEYIWLSGVEACVFGKFAGATFNEHCKNTVWRYPSLSETDHPTEKPIKLMKRIVLASTNTGDTVLDFCMGSGTTGVACMQLGRKFIGCELDPAYFAIAEKRIKAAASQEIMF